MSEASIVVSAIDNTRASFDSVKASLQGMQGTVGALQSSMLGLASAVGLVSAAMSIKNVIQGAAELDKLSKQAGIAVEALSGLAVVGKATGTAADQIASASNKLSKALATSTEESKGAAAALKALGLSFDDFQRMAPDARMKSVADAMGQFADGGQKSAAAMLLFGKTGAEMLPFLKDLAETGELHAKVTAEQAHQAHELEVAWIRLGTQTQSWKRTMAMELLPTLLDVVEAMKSLTQSSGAAGSIIGEALKDSLQTVAVLGANIVYVFKQIGTEIGGIAAQLVQFLSGNFKGAFAIGDEMKLDAIAARREVDKLSTSLLGLTNSRAGAGQSAMGMNDPRVLGPITKPELTGLRGSAGAVDPQIKAYQGLIAAIREKIAANDLETDSGRKLTEAEKQRLAIQKMVETGTISQAQANSGLTKTMLETLRLSELGKQVRESEYKQAMEIAQARQKLVKDGYDQAVVLEEQTIAAAHKRSEWADKSLEQIKVETDALTENTVTRDIGNAMRLAEVEGIKRGTSEWEAYRNAVSTAITARDGIKKSIDDFKQVWDSVDKTAQTTFTNIFEGGQSAFTKLRDTLKATLLDLLYQMTARKWLFDITASLTGQSAGVAGAVAQASNLGSGMNSLGSLGNAANSAWGWLTGGGVAASTAEATATAAATGEALTAAGASFAEASAASTALAGTMTGAATGLTAALAAVPVWGWAALGAIAIFSGGKGHGPKTEGGYAPGGLDIAGVDIGGNMQGSQRGDVASAQGLSAGISQSFAALATQLGLVNKKLDVGVFFAKDANGTSMSQLQITSSAGYNRSKVAGGIENVGRSDAEFQAAVTDATSQLLLEALKSSDLAQQYKDMLSGIADNAGTAQIQTAINRITAAKTQQAQLEDTLFQLTATDLEKLNRTRERERAVIDPTNAALLEQLYAKQDAIKAEAAAQAAALKAQADATAAASKAAKDQAQAQSDLKAALDATNAGLKATTDGGPGHSAAVGGRHPRRHRTAGDGPHGPVQPVDRQPGPARRAQLWHQRRRQQLHREGPVYRQTERLPARQRPAGWRHQRRDERHQQRQLLQQPGAGVRPHGAGRPALAAERPHQAAAHDGRAAAEVSGQPGERRTGPGRCLARHRQERAQRDGRRQCAACRHV
jgi:hypothetical protein